MKNTGSPSIEDVYQWRFLRLNEIYRSEYNKASNSALDASDLEPEQHAESFARKWSMSTPVDYNEVSLPEGFYFYPGIIENGLSSAQELLDGESPIGPHSLQLRLRDDYHSKDKKYLPLVVDLGRFSDNDISRIEKLVKAYRKNRIQQLGLEKSFPQRIKTSTADLDSILKAYELHIDGATVSNIAQKVFSISSARTLASYHTQVKSLLETGKKYIKLAPFIPFDLNNDCK